MIKMNFVTNVLKKYIQNDPEAIDKAENQENAMDGKSDDKENNELEECSRQPPKLRLSFLKAFDPLYSESYNQVRVADWCESVDEIFLPVNEGDNSSERVNPEPEESAATENGICPLSSEECQTECVDDVPCNGIKISSYYPTLECQAQGEDFLYDSETEHEDPIDTSISSTEEFLRAIDPIPDEVVLKSTSEEIELEPSFCVSSLSKDSDEFKECQDKIVDQEKEDNDVPPEITKVPASPFDGSPVKSDQKVEIEITEEVEKVLKTNIKVAECSDNKKEIQSSETDTTVSDLSDTNIVSTEGEVSETDLEVLAISASLGELSEECGKKDRVISDTAINIKMADLSDNLNKMQQENSELKLKLNALQQAKAALELDIQHKEEVIKTQTESLKNENKSRQEIKIEKDPSKDLEELMKEANAREAKAIADVKQSYEVILEEYDNMTARRIEENKKLKEEHETATRHLANMELAFSDLHQKYERTKTVVLGFKTNEEILKQELLNLEKMCKQHEERYESLKAHATAQIENANKEIYQLRDKSEMDINKLRTVIKRLEIKCSSLDTSLQQKTEECAALSALCDEVTGKRM